MEHKPTLCKLIVNYSRHLLNNEGERVCVCVCGGGGGAGISILQNSIHIPPFL